MSLRARLAVIAAVGFIIQTVGGFIVVKGSYMGLVPSIIGSITIGFALGFDRAVVAAERVLTGGRKSRR